MIGRALDSGATAPGLQPTRCTTTTASCAVSEGRQMAYVLAGLLTSDCGKADLCSIE